ncbi:MAG TPA: hypothetical protein VFC72_06630 [Corynebacterium sp.]|nr:hypothetical protein [Corynebacterium sp.]
MSATNHLAVSDFASETYPNYEARLEDAYIDGYDPVSLGAPHSSLNRSSTWIGMGLLIAGLAGFGVAIFSAAQMIWGAGATVDRDPSTLLIVGLVAGVVITVFSSFLIRHGRRYYRDYKERTGRVN